VRQAWEDRRALVREIRRKGGTAREMGTTQFSARMAHSLPVFHNQHLYPADNAGDSDTLTVRGSNPCFLHILDL
jgi:hypothetical protein